MIARLLAAGTGKSILPATFDDRRKTLNKQQKELLDLQEIFSKGLDFVTVPVVITNLPATAQDLLARKNLAGLTSLHVVAGGEFGACCRFWVLGTKWQ